MNVQRPSGAAMTGYAIVILMLVVAVAFGAFELVSTAVAVARDGKTLIGGDRLDVHVQLPPDRVPLPDGMRLRGWPEGIVEVDHPTRQQVLLCKAMDLGPVMLFIAGLWLLRGLARSVREGDPFGADNVRRLRGIGFILVLGAPLVEFLEAGMRTSLYNRLPPGQFGDFGVEGIAIPGAPLRAWLGAFILAEVFAHGVRLREDVEGTV